MVEKWISVYGKETVEKMGKAFLEERPVTVRRNTAVVSKEEFEKELEKMVWSIADTRYFLMHMN